MTFDLFLKKCGRLFFARMSPLFFFLLLGLPVVGTSLYIFFAHAELQDLEERFAHAARKEKISFARKMRKDRFLERYSQADPYFLDQQLEVFPLLTREKEKLQALQHHPAFPESRSLGERIRFLNENKLAFKEENIRTNSQIKEMDEKLRYVVQMDEADLKQILSLIENVPIGPYVPFSTSPQLIVKDIRIKKMETPFQTEVCEVDMDLLKREFIKP